MSVKLQSRGRQVTDADVAFIQRLIADHPELSRRALSPKLCQAWNWVQPNGHPRDMVCRGLMLALHRAGHIELPECRQTPANPLVQRSRPAVVDIDRAPLHGSLQALGSSWRSRGWNRCWRRSEPRWGKTWPSRFVSFSRATYNSWM